MHKFSSTSARILAVAAALSVAVGCGSSDSDPDANPNSGPLNEYVTALPPWQQPPPDEDVLTDLPVEMRDKMDANGGTTRFACQRTQHDVLKSHTSILSLGSSQAALKPGILLQGTPYRNGTLQSIPIPRSPVTLSIDLPVPTPTVTVENPDTAALQQAIATLQIAASSELTDLPALVAYSRQETTSQTQMSLQIGASLEYSTELSSVNFQAAFANQETQERYTVVAQLMQPMYTISFADDAIAEPSQFFAPTVTAADLMTQETLGTIGPDNLPVFVSSVTYGRMVVFTATSTQATSAMQISAALDASVAAYKGGATLDVETQDFLSSLQVEVLAIGGNAAAVGSALVSGDYSLLFDSADATSAVPLKFAVKNLAGARPAAGIGDALQFVEENCTAITALGWVEAAPSVGTANFRQVSVGANGDVWAVADNEGDVYKYNPTTMMMELIDDNANARAMSVDADGTAYGLINLGGNTQRVRRHNAVGAGFITNASIETASLRNFDVRDGWIWGHKFDDQFNVYPAGASGWTNLAPNMATGSSLSVAEATNAWFRSGSTASPGVPAMTLNSSSVVTQRTDNSLAVTPIAASAAEVWGLDSSFAIRKLDMSTTPFFTWNPSPLPAPPESIVSIDVGPNGNVWAITGEGKLLHWVE